ncbi:MAG: hypothetical protein LBG58_13240 [Planctomycetaceae bacterium]|nr:hypothetical protein [Planctomycetaceae bacterium]
MKTTISYFVGLFIAAMFILGVERQLCGSDRYASPMSATGLDYTLDGTLEPDEIPDFTPIHDVFRSNRVINGTMYAPDAAILAVDGPIQLPNLSVQANLVKNGISPPKTEISPSKTEISLSKTEILSSKTESSKTTVSSSPMEVLSFKTEIASFNSDEIPLTLPPRFRSESDLLNINEKYALVQYRSKNRSPKHDDTPEESKPKAAVLETPSVREIAAMTDAEKAAVLKKSISAALTVNMKRAVTTQNNTPGDILLMALPYGADAKVYQPTVLVDQRDKTTPRGSYIYSIGTLCWNYPCSGKTLLRSDGKRVYARVGSGFQRRPASFLALLAMSNIMPNYELKVNGGIYSIGHLIASEKAAVSKGSNMSMALVGLSFYGEAGEQWKNEMGETWNIERMVTEELNRSIDQGSSDVTDWLLGLTAAVKLYEEEGKAVRGPMALAKRQLGTYHEFVLSVQNDQYLWHPKFFLFKGSNPDFYETLYSSGHILRWLLLSLSDKELNDPRVTRAVTSLLSTVNRIPTNLAVGAMTDRQLEGLALSLHALSVYYQRVFGEEQPEEPEKSKSKIPENVNAKVKVGISENKTVAKTLK